MGRVTVAADNVGTPIFLNRDGVFPDNMIPYNYGITETLAMSGIRDGVQTCEMPMLAKSWEVAPDRSAVTFHLHEGVHFHSYGRDWGEMTAEDVVWSMNDSFIPESKHSSAGEMSQNFKPWKVIDTYTVEAPFNVFRSDWILDNTVSMCHDSVSVLSKKAFDELGPEKLRGTPHGTGPFVVRDWLPRERMEAEALPNHWRFTPAFKELIIIEAPEGAVRTAMLKTGEADLSLVPISDIPGLQALGYEFHEGLGRYEGLYVTFGGNYWANKVPETGEPIERVRDTRKPWIGDPYELGNEYNEDTPSMQNSRLVRWAMAMAIDRETLVQTVLGGFGAPVYAGGTGGVYPEHPEWKDKWRIPSDPDSASQYLADAGYPNGFGMEFYCPVDIGVSKEVCLAVAGMWQEHLNLQVRLDTSAYTSRRPDMVGRNFPVVWMPPWAPTRKSTMDPGGACCRVFPETTGGYNIGIEAEQFYDYYVKTGTQAMGSPENLATREELFDWSLHWMFTAGVVEYPTLVGMNRDRVVSWGLQPHRLINSFETIVLRR